MLRFPTKNLIEFPTQVQTLFVWAGFRDKIVGMNTRVILKRPPTLLSTRTNLQVAITNSMILGNN